MEKIIRIGNNSILLKTTAGVLIHYKQQFGRDYTEDYALLADCKEDSEHYAELFCETGLRLLWAMARTANSIAPPSEWLTGIAPEELLTAIVEASKLFGDSISKAESSAESSGNAFNVETLIAEALVCGLTMEDLDRMPLPMVLKTIDEWLRVKGYSDDVKEADQNDFDNF